jgi:hypothetical protein
MSDDEIERLRSEIGQWRRACSSYVEVLAAQDAELKRLRRHVDELRQERSPTIFKVTATPSANR